MSTRYSLSLDEAWVRLERSVPEWRPPVERIATEEASGRILAKHATALADSPPADNSAMDGFALNSNDVALNQPVAVSQRIAAGTAPVPLETGTAARIFTGAVIPDGADSVVIQENCDHTDQTVTVLDGLRAGANIRRRASDIKHGEIVLTRNTSVRPQEIGLLLSSGVGAVHVFTPLRVGVIATGDELVEVSQDLNTERNASDQRKAGRGKSDHSVPPPGKIFESNSPMIAAKLNAMGCTATRYRARDTHEDTVNVLTRALAENDAVLTIGGVSVGEEDHVQEALNRVGRTEFWKINIKPGKPFLFGEASNKPVMGLPGNPVSSFVTFTLFCMPFLRKLQGRDFAVPVRIPAIAGFSSDRVSDRVDHLRGRVCSWSPDLVVEPVGSQSSSIQGALCAADVLIVIPANTAVKKGQRLAVILL